MSTLLLSLLQKTEGGSWKKGQEVKKSRQVLYDHDMVQKTSFHALSGILAASLGSNLHHCARGCRDRAEKGTKLRCRKRTFRMGLTCFYSSLVNCWQLSGHTYSFRLYPFKVASQFKMYCEENNFGVMRSFCKFWFYYEYIFFGLQLTTISMID